MLQGNDLTTMSNETLEILTAPELIAINQDTLVIQAVVAAVRVYNNPDRHPLSHFCRSRLHPLQLSRVAVEDSVHW